MIPVLVALWGCTSPDPEPPVLRPVRVEVARETGGTLDGVFSGTTEARDAAVLSFLTGGTVAAVEVGVGDRVRSGAVLARLEGTSQALQVEQARAGVASAQAGLRHAQQTHERTEQLFVAGSATTADLEGARAQHEASRAQLASAQRQLDLARTQQDHTVLRAGRDGAITQVLAHARENVGAGTPVVELTPDQELSVEVSVPERWVGRLEPGAPASLRVPSVGELPLVAHVAEVGGAGRSGAFPVTVQLDADHPGLRPGMVAEVHLRAEGDARPRIELPLAAIAEDARGPFVWTVVDVDGTRGRIQAVRVGTGDLVGADRVVVHELAAGTVVVTAGARLLYEGRMVQVGVP